MSEEAGLSQWVPVLGTLGGALLGFFASFLTALFTKSRESKEQREERNRRRVERIYELLIIISQENGQHLVGAINWVHYGRPIKQDATEGIPPLIELEMLVSLYFEELEVTRQELMKSIQKFGKRYLEIQYEDFRSKPNEVRQEVSGEFVTMNARVNEKITAFKALVSQIVKS